MPFKSDKQRKYLWWKKPEVAQQIAYKNEGGPSFGSWLDSRIAAGYDINPFILAKLAESNPNYRDRAGTVTNEGAGFDTVPPVAPAPVVVEKPVVNEPAPVVVEQPVAPLAIKPKPKKEKKKKKPKGGGVDPRANRYVIPTDASGKLYSSTFGSDLGHSPLQQFANVLGHRQQRPSYDVRQLDARKRAELQAAHDKSKGKGGK